MLVLMTDFDEYLICSSISTLSSMEVMWRKMTLCVQGILMQTMLTRQGKKYFIGRCFTFCFSFFGIVFKFKVPHNALISKLDLNSAT